MSHAIHSNSSELLARHQSNMMASLARRLEAARARNNSQLIELLERERQQIAAPLHPEAPAERSHSPADSWWNRLTQAIGQLLSGQGTLEVSQLACGSDRWWYAFDPQTGNCVYADSEAELRLWIKENYRGK